MRKNWQYVACLVGTLGLAHLSQLAAGQLGHRPAADWIQTLERPERVEALKIDYILSKLDLKAGQTVVDVGAGAGVFSFPLAAAVLPGGRVYAVELEQGFLDHIDARARDRNIANIETVLGQPTDPRLPAKDVDLAFIHDVLHHVADRPGYLKSLARYMRPGGRVAIIELSASRGSHREDPELIVTVEQVDRWMTDAGFQLVERIDGLPDEKWFSIYERVSHGHEH